MSKEMDTERFVSVPGFPAYRISNWGNVQTCYCPNGWYGLTETWRPLKAGRMRHGYMIVALQKDKKTYKRLIHRLVLEAFVGPCPPSMEARHVVDNDPANNRLANLRWGTRQENADDRARHGTQVRGETCRQARLTEAAVREIRELHAQGVVASELARRFGVIKRSIFRVCSREAWAHVE